MSYKILSWNSYQIKPSSELGHIKPLVVVNQIPQQHLDLLHQNSDKKISLQIMDTELYDTFVNANIMNITEDGRVFMLLDFEWLGYPYNLGNVNILSSDVTIKQPIPVQTYSNMCIKTYEHNYRPQTVECIHNQDIFKFRKNLYLTTKQPNYNLTPDIIAYINEHSIV